MHKVIQKKNQITLWQFSRLLLGTSAYKTYCFVIVQPLLFFTKNDSKIKVINFPLIYRTNLYVLVL